MNQNTKIVIPAVALVFVFLGLSACGIGLRLLPLLKEASYGPPDYPDQTKRGIVRMGVEELDEEEMDGKPIRMRVLLEVQNERWHNEPGPMLYVGDRRDFSLQSRDGRSLSFTGFTMKHKVKTGAIAPGETRAIELTFTGISGTPARLVYQSKFTDNMPLILELMEPDKRPSRPLPRRSKAS